MPQYYTLEEAAKVLHMPAEQLREKARKKEVRAFQDRGNWRFLAQQIDELARERGIGSEPELQLGDPSAKPAAKGENDRLAVDFNLEDDSVPIGKEKLGDKAPRSTKSGPKSPVKPSGGDSDVRLVMDSNLDFQIDLDSDVKVESSGPKSPSPKSPSPKPGGPKSSGTRSGRKSKVDDSGPRLVDKPNDSDVKVPPSSKDSDIRAKPSSSSQSPSDSDIRLQDLPSSMKKGSDGGIITEEIDLDAEEARSASQLKPAAKPKRGTRAVPNPPVLPTTSPFELSENDLNLDEPPAARPPGKGAKGGAKGSSKAAKPEKEETDSSSDFELIPFDASKSPKEDLGSGEIPLLSGDEEVGLGDMPTPNAGNSGINLKPRDSGISLESGGSDELEFELTLDSGVTPKPAASKASKKKSKVDDDSSSEFELSLDDSPSDASDSEFELSLDDESSSETEGLQPGENSDSEFELTLDDEGGLAVEDEDGKDIFEETNFDVPALEDESGSEAVAIDESDTDLEGSDFEISLDDDSGTSEESESQVVSLPDEEADDAAATIARPRKTKSKTKAKITVDEEEPELDLEDLEASGPRKKAKADEEDEDEGEEEEEDEVVSAAPAAPVEWGPLPAILLAPTVLVLFLVGLMGFELIQSMWGYHRPAKVGRPIIDAIARAFDDTLPKE